MSSWLANRLGIHLNLRPLAPIAGGVLGGIVGGPAGAAWGAGLARGLDDKAHGSSWQDSLKHGATTGVLTYAGGKGLEKLRSAFGGAQPGFTPSSSAPIDPAENLSGVGSSGPAFGAGGATPTPSVGGGGSGFSLGSAVKGIGSFAQKNPQATGLALQGLGNLGTMGSENAYRRAQTHALDLNNQGSEYELEAKKRRDAALAPLMALMQGQLQQRMNTPYQVAKNPYS